MGFAYKAVLTVGLQILCALGGGWVAARLKTIDPAEYTPRLNRFAVKVLAPCLNIWILGIKTSMRDIQTWRLIGVFILWNTLVDLLCAIFVRLRQRKFVAGYALYSTALAYNNTGIIGPVMCEAVLGSSMISLGLPMFISIPMFLQQVTLLLICFEAQRTINQKQDQEPSTHLPPAADPIKPGRQDLAAAPPHLTVSVSTLKGGKPVRLPSMPSTASDAIGCDRASMSRTPSFCSDTDTSTPSHSPHHPCRSSSPACELTRIDQLNSVASTHPLGVPVHPLPAEAEPDLPVTAPGGGGQAACCSRLWAWPAAVVVAARRRGSAFMDSLPPVLQQLINIVVLNPLVNSMLVGMAMSLAGLNRYLDPDQPQFIWELGFIEGTLRWFARATAPLTMFAQGLWLYGKVNVSSWTRQGAAQVGLFMLARLTIMPVSMAVVAKYCGLPDEYCVGLLVMTALPVGQLAFVFAEQYNVCAGFVTALMITCTFTMLPQVIVMLELVQRWNVFDWKPPHH